MTRSLLVFLVLAGCAPPRAPAPRPTEVIVLGMIHGEHRKSTRYSLEVLEGIIGRIHPTHILAEIPPARLPRALAEFSRTGTVTEPRVKLFPEYTEVIIPRRVALGYTLVGCAGWTRAMAEDRRAKLARWKTERPADTRRVDHDPRAIHTPAYDALVKEALGPYDALFNEDLGLGGWTNINRAHYALIAAELDRLRGSGARVLITFGAWHKYWILEQLRRRDDVHLVDPRRFME